MATLFFVRSGRGNDRTRIGCNVSATRILEALSRHELKFSPSAPVMNPEVVSSTYLPYEHVVVEVADNELSAKFPTAGYYWVLDLSPTACVTLLPESRQEA